MVQSNPHSVEALLNHANELLSRKWRPRRRIRWWNLALVPIFVIGFFAVIGPLVHPAFRQGFSGNLVSSAWQLIAGALMAWIFYNRFRAERFKRAMPISWADAFTEMGKISLKLYPDAIGEATDLRNALNSELRERLIELALAGRQKGILFARFFEIEEIADIDQACDMAEKLARIDDRLEDPKYMTAAIYAIWGLYVYPSRVRGYTPSLSLTQSLDAARQRFAQMGG